MLTGRKDFLWHSVMCLGGSVSHWTFCSVWPEHHPVAVRRCPRSSTASSAASSLTPPSESHTHSHNITDLHIRLLSLLVSVTLNILTLQNQQLQNMTDSVKYDSSFSLESQNNNVVSNTSVCYVAQLSPQIIVKRWWQCCWCRHHCYTIICENVMKDSKLWSGLCLDADRTAQLSLTALQGSLRWVVFHHRESSRWWRAGLFFSPKVSQSHVVEKLKVFCFQIYAQISGCRSRSNLMPKREETLSCLADEARVCWQVHAPLRTAWNHCADLFFSLDVFISSNSALSLWPSNKSHTRPLTFLSSQFLPVLHQSVFAVVPWRADLEIWNQQSNRDASYRSRRTSEQNLAPDRCRLQTQSYKQCISHHL